MSDEEYFVQKIKIGDKWYEKRTPKRFQGEPHLVDTEAMPDTQRPKWMTPKAGSIQEKILHAVGRKYYLSREEWNTLQQIAKDSLPLEGGPSKYPLEWIEEKLQYTIDARSRGKLINLKGVVTMITNHDRLVQWMNRRNVKGKDNEGF